MAEKIDLIAYSTDASGIEGNATKVAFPKSAEEISRIIRQENNIVIRGGGSGLAGGAVPFNSAVMDLSKMNKILSLNLQEKTIEVEPGIILDELNEFLSSYSLEFPVQPSSHGICSIGGMIATNAAGSRAIKYGKTEKWVLSLEIVDGNGNITRINKLDLKDFSGLEGITGIIVKAKLKLIEKKERTASLFSFDSIDEVIEKTYKLKSHSEVSEIEFLGKTSSSLLGLGEKYTIIAEFESDEGELTKNSYTRIMNLRDKAYPILAKAGFTLIEDPKIPLFKFKELASFLEEEKIPYFGHLGMGIIHPVFIREEKEKIRKMFKIVEKLKGEVSGEHGIGLTKKEFLDNFDKKVIERVKRRYDPLCKINPGKVIDLEKKQVEIIKPEEKKENRGVEEKQETRTEEKTEEVNINEENKEKDDSKNN